MNTTQHNKIQNDHKIAEFSRQKSRLRGCSLETGSLLSRAGRCKTSVCSATLSSCTDYPAHQNKEENVNKNVKSKSLPFPGNGAKNLIGANKHSKMCIFEVNEMVCVLMFSQYFRYSIGSTGRIHRDGGDRSINSLYSRVMLTSSSLLRNYKKERKEKKRKSRMW